MLMIISNTKKDSYLNVPEILHAHNDQYLYFYLNYVT